MTSCRFEDLHPEIREIIFSYLDIRSLLSACRVNRTWHGWISSASKIWRRPCLSIGLQIKDEKYEIFSRSLFVHLSRRKRSLKAGCFSPSSYVDRGLLITAIYYYGGKLTTSFPDGVIRLWDCIANGLAAYRYVCLWTSVPQNACVTSMKFNDHIVMASYGNGSIAAWCTSTGCLKRIYTNPFAYAETVDYMTEANLVVSARYGVVVWNISTGQLLEKRYLPHDTVALKVVVGPYPGEEYEEGGHAIRRSLIVCMNEKYVFVWVATYSGENQSDMNFVMEFLREIWIACKKSSCRQFLGGSYGRVALFLDGKYLYFTKHSRRKCKGTVCQYDVIKDRMVSKVRLPSRIKLLLGVGKKYMLMILSTATGRNDELVVMERESCDLIIRKELESQINTTPGTWTPPCLGEKSWLDGFDGDNDIGVVYASVFHPGWVRVTSWRS